jgi:hypothetical protein
MQEHIKTVTDAAAATIAVGVIGKWIGPLAGLFTIIWLGIRIWESETVKKLTGRYKE